MGHMYLTSCPLGVWYNMASCASCISNTVTPAAAALYKNTSNSICMSSSLKISWPSLDRYLIYKHFVTGRLCGVFRRRSFESKYKFFKVRDQNYLMPAPGSSKNTISSRTRYCTGNDTKFSEPVVQLSIKLSSEEDALREIMNSQISKNEIRCDSEGSQGDDC